jgi:cbb3-type cytochrome oxidase subunit 3
MRAFIMSNFSLGEYALVGFAGFWGVVGLGIIVTAGYFWLKQRNSRTAQNLASRRH